MQIKYLVKRPKVYFIADAIYLYNKGLPNDRKLQLSVERLYDETLRKTLEPRWDEFKHYHTQHQLKIYEDFVESRQWDACREYAKDIRPNVTSHHPLADRIAFFLPPRISYFLVHTYRRLRKA